MSDLIKQNVKAYISSAANMPVSEIKDEYVLKEDPLKLDDTKLGFLTLSLRGYIKTLNPSETITVKEIRKNGLSVKGTCELVVKKIES